MESPVSLSLADLEAFDPHGGRGAGEKLYRCPVCQSDERALHLNTETGLWNCKRASCGAKGKLTEHWEQKTPQNRTQRAQGALKQAFAPSSPKPKAAPATADLWRAVYDACTFVEDSPGAAYLQDRGITTEIYSEAGVLFGHRSERPGVVFPFVTREGEACAIAMRFIDGKLINGEPQNHRTLGPRSDGVFMAQADVLRAPRVFVAEAPIDALSLAMCGFPAIALGGTSMPSWLPVALGMKQVLLALDNDSNGAGDEKSEVIRRELQKYGATVARLTPWRERGETKSDWNEMLLKHGPRVLYGWIRARLSHIEYFEFGELGHAPK